MRQFRITSHAQSRFTERGPVGSSLATGLSQGIPFGHQLGRDFMLLLPCGLVAVCVRSEGYDFVKTVLTRDHATANCQMYRTGRPRKSRRVRVR
jgi:hypothetical protein